MWHFNKKKKEDNEKMTTLEQIRKAYDDLSDDDKKAFHQSISDRVHESIGEQEHDDGDKDSQSAADREHEALGEEHADGKGDVSELHETDPKADESRGDNADDKTEENKDSTETGESDALKALREDVAKLAARLELLERTPQKADENTASKLSQLEKLYD